MYIVISFTGLLVLVALVMYAAYLIVQLFSFCRSVKPNKTNKKLNKEERLWERLKENRQDTFKNSSQ